LTIVVSTPRSASTALRVPGAASGGSASRQRGIAVLSARSRSAAHCSALPISIAPDACAIGTASAAWSKCACPMKIASGRSAASSAGEDGT
jgi:hypothetical protein